jgi:hypothetical protein
LRQRHPVILPFRAFAHDHHPSRIPFHRHVRNRASTAAGLSSRRPGIRHPEFKMLWWARAIAPFALSVAMMFWAFFSGLLVLTGAHLSAQRHVRI